RILNSGGGASLLLFASTHGPRPIPIDIPNPPEPTPRSHGNAEYSRRSGHPPGERSLPDGVHRQCWNRPYGATEWSLVGRSTLHAPGARAGRRCGSDRGKEGNSQGRIKLAAQER